MPTSAKSGFGLLFAVGDAASPEVFTTLAETVDVKGPGVKAALLNATNNDSANNAAEKIPSGIVDYGEITITTHHLPANATQKNFRNDCNNRTKRNVKITWPDGSSTVWGPFAGYVTGYGPGAPHDGKMTIDWTYEVTEKPTLNS